MTKTKEEKICFVIMPISDQDDYEKGHFARVYQHIIKPACELAGFKPVRADDEVKTNYIVVDIIKKVLDSHIVICDLSAKNPNVLYELGIRQSFNKKSVLIKDKKTNRIFDIQGLRTIDYDENLRIDEVQKSISTIAKTIKETYEQNDDEVNSLIQLLSIKPAELKSFEISQESSIIMDSLNDISNRLYNIENKEKRNFLHSYTDKVIINGQSVKLGETLYNKELHNIGELVDFTESAIFVKKDNQIKRIERDSELFSELIDLPF